jgi:hypothetical protein
MKKGINVWSFPVQSLEQTFKMAKDAGFDGVELALFEEGELDLNTTEEGMLKALDMIAKEAPEAADKLKAKLEKGEITWEVKVKAQEYTDKELTDYLESLFSGYELSIELDKLNIPSDFAQGFFDVAVNNQEDFARRCSC